jgi:RHS repeat-associated protein
MDDKQRIALVRLGPAQPDDQGPATQFHLGDHLGSTNAIADASGALTNREEFTPYGETSFGSFVRKRYRFTGKERDEESGINYHHARYLSLTLCRWLSCDPIREAGGLNQFLYVNANPLRSIDPRGTDQFPGETQAHSEWDAILESLWGGEAHTDSEGHTNIEGPKGGPGGMIGGALSAATFRLAPTEDHPNAVSSSAMDFGEAMFPTPQDAIARLVTGTTVSGAKASRLVAGIETGLFVVSHFPECAIGGSPGEALDAAEEEMEASRLIAARPRVVQTSSDALVRDSTFAMANRTGHQPVPLDQGTLAGVDEATLVGHGVVPQSGGGAIAVNVGGRPYTPKALAGALVDAGWEGGTLRLAVCKAGTSCLNGPSFAQELADQLRSMGIDTAVIAPEGRVDMLWNTHGLPRVEGPDGTYLQPGEGWNITTGSR